MFLVHRFHFPLMLRYDGFQPFESHMRYTSTPMLLSPLLVPEPWRSKLQHLAVTVPGLRKKAAKGDIRPTMRVLIDEISYLSTHGVEVFDAARQKTIIIYPDIILVISDYRGLMDALGEI